MTRQFVFAGRTYCDQSGAFVIAEIGHNHQGNLEQCKQLFRAAKGAGASAVKLQKRDNRTLFTRDAYDEPYNSENAFAATYGEHREFLEFGRDEYLELKRYATEIDIPFFSTAFDHASADFLEDIDLPGYKLASADITNLPLLTYVAKFGKPMILSTGGANMEDVQRAFDAVMPINGNIAILQCTASYPCAFEDLNLKVIETYRDAFPETVIGLSAHDNGYTMGLVAYMLGARVIEKHFTLNRAMKGTDHPFSLEASGLRRLVRDLDRIRIAMGDGHKRRLPTEEAPLRKMAKKIVMARDLPAGHVLREEDFAFRSPGDGLPPYRVNDFIGRSLSHAVEVETTFSEDLVCETTDNEH